MDLVDEVRIRRQPRRLGAVWCGCRPKARRIRDTVDCDRPVSFAVARVDQCVAFLGVDSSVLVTTAATCSSVTVLGPPGRGMSPSPAIRCSTNRFRQRPTACGVEPSRAATSLFDAPLAQARMIRHRKAHACGVERRRTHPSSAVRSASDRTNSAFGRPVRATPQPCTSEQNSRLRRPAGGAYADLVRHRALAFEAALHHRHRAEPGVRRRRTPAGAMLEQLLAARAVGPEHKTRTRKPGHDRSRCAQQVGGPLTRARRSPGRRREGGGTTRRGGSRPNGSIPPCRCRHRRTSSPAIWGSRRCRPDPPG